MWMLFMQPIKLHGMYHAWGLERDPSLIRLWPEIKKRDPTVRVLLAYIVTALLGVMIALFGAFIGEKIQMHRAPARNP
jgi:hypothetical protein